MLRTVSGELFKFWPELAIYIKPYCTVRSFAVGHTGKCGTVVYL